MRVLQFFRRNLYCFNSSAFHLIFRTYIRPHLEYCSPAWIPFLKKDKLQLEGVLRKATKLVAEVHDLPYPMRREMLNTQPMHYRRVRGCLIFCFKLFLHNELNTFFSAPLVSHLRGHPAKMFVTRSSSSSRRNFFAQFIILIGICCHPLYSNVHPSHPLKNN